MTADPISNPVKILIVEDSPTQAEQLRYILERREFRVISARNGREALEIMHAQKPTMVITDINMPEMDGYELCHRIRGDAQLAEVPVILLTSLSDSEDVFKGLECGADNFITKPYDENNLLARIHYLLANVHLRNRETMQISMEVYLAGRRHVITSNRAQILNLLLSTYEAAVQKNRELSRARDDLAQLNGQLEEKVVERTASLSAEIVERKRVQESMTLFRALIDQSSDAIVVIDPETGRYLDVNESTCQRLGYTREEMLAMNISDVEIIAVTVSSMHAIAEELRRSGSKMVEGRHRRKDGTTFPVEINVQYITLNRSYLVAVVRDITERKRAAEQIEEQAALLNKTQDAIIVRSLEGGILFWNKGAERMYGWVREEVLGRNVGELLYANPRWFEEIENLAIRRGEWSGEIQHLAKDGSELTVETRLTLVRDNDGNPKSVLAINTDITEKKKIEAQFMRAQRMESIGTLAGGIAHDLNNILAPIMMSIDILKTTATHPQAKNILETIEVSTRRGADIVRQVLSFARGLEGQRIEVQPKHLLKDIETIIKDTFPKDIRFQISIPDDVWTLLGDPTQLHQILLNLCVNARDAMPEGGVLTIDVGNQLLDEQYVAMNIQATVGPHVVLSVTDTGTGIPKAIFEKIFEPFFTTKEVGKGTGLGLSTVMAIAKSHGGFVNVYSEAGKGTTFKVYIPAHLAATNLGEQPEPVNLPRGHGETILIIDDEASILTITSQTLQAFGYRVLTASDGAAAVAVYAEHRREIAVVLTDMAMPVMDGTATIHALLRMNPKVKLIAASGLGANGSVLKASEAGVTHFLLKPYTAGTLLKMLKLVLETP